MDGRQLAVSFSLLQGRTASTGTTTSTSYLKGQSRWPSICCTGTATAPMWRQDPQQSAAPPLPWRNQLVKGSSGSATPASGARQVKTPVLLVSAVDDHIAPGKAPGRAWRCSAASDASSWPSRAISPASSTRRRPTNTASGRARSRPAAQRRAGGRDPQHRPWVARDDPFHQGRDEGRARPVRDAGRGWRRRQAATSRCGSQPGVCQRPAEDAA